MKLHQKLCKKKRSVIDRGKRNKTPNEVKPAKNIYKNPWSFLGTGLEQNEVPPSHNLQDHAYEEYQNPVKLKKDNLSQKNS